MNKIINIKENRGVISLMVILGIGLFVLAITLTLTGQIVVEIIKGRNTISGDRSFHAAEAAVREGVYQYLSTTTYSGGTPQLINDVSEGSISVTSSALGVAHRDIIGTAKNNLTNRKVIYTLVFLEGLAFEYAIFSSDDISLGGNASTSGNTFSNGSTTATGSSEINGDAAAVGTVTGNVTGSKTEGENPITFPEINMDFDEYKAIADSNGTLFANAADFDNYLDGNTRTGVIFASTTASINLNEPATDLSGSAVTLGDLKITNGKFSSPDDRATIVVAGDFEIQGGEIEGNVYIEGDFKMTGGSTIKGIVYVKGATTFGAGNPTIEGAIISLEGVTMLGTSEIIYNSDILANWYKFGGFDATMTIVPNVIAWREE